MNDMRYDIVRKFRVLLLCIIMGFIPFYLCAQDEDSTFTAPDSAMSSLADEEHRPGSNKFSNEPVFRSVPDSTVERMKKEKEFAYANDPAYWVKEKKVYKKGFWDYVFDFFESDTTRIIFYILLAALIMFVLYRIVVLNELFVFYSSKIQKKAADTPSETDPLIIDQHIRDAISQKNYPMAVRYLYLKSLYELNDKGLIQFHPEATDSNYLNQMSQHRRFEEFSFLTRVYEYTWYGKFDITEQQFSLIHHSFKNFQTGT
jgi:hypothetical protein